MKPYKIIYLLIIVSTLSYTQSNFYLPLNIKTAYEKGTRSIDGNPGKKYWQNRSRYNIKVNLNPNTKILEGVEDILYFNNSPDSLSNIIIRLYHNIFKPDARRDFNIDPQSLTEGVLIQKINVDGSEIDLNDNSHVNISGTNLILKLNSKLASQNSISLNISWSTEIPSVEAIRLGSYDSTSMFIAYWYPQIAVYDDVDGWDRLDYTGILEMYNDFNNYNVEFTVPTGFQIWATGVWQNPEEILNKKYLDRYNSAWKSDEVIRIITRQDLESKNIYKSDNDFYTFKFKAENVTDFAFGISDHYLWDAVSFIPDSNSESRVYCTAAYKETSKDFVDVAYYAKEALKYYSYEIPGISFPYPSATVFNGSGGMEFPMIVNNGSASTKAGTVHLTSHELCHQYLPFYMGTNERKYPFMDEGWAVMLPFDFQERMAEGYTPRQRYASYYEEFAGNEYDLPIIIPSPTISYRSYRTSAYNKSSMAYEILRQMLGDKLIKKAMKTYMERWNGKHPIPTDFFFTFNDATGLDLGWFWKRWFYDFGFPDLAISNVKQQNNSLIITLLNKGHLPLPIKLQVMENGLVTKDINESPEIWNTDENKIEIKISGVKNYDAIILGSVTIPDVNKVDNVYIK